MKASLFWFGHSALAFVQQLLRGRRGMATLGVRSSPLGSLKLLQGVHTCGHRSGVALPMPLRPSVQIFTTASFAEVFFNDNYYDGVRKPGGPGVRGVGVQGGCG